MPRIQCQWWHHWNVLAWQVTGKMSLDEFSWRNCCGKIVWLQVGSSAVSVQCGKKLTISSPNESRLRVPFSQSLWRWRVSKPFQWLQEWWNRHSRLGKYICSDLERRFGCLEVQNVLSEQQSLDPAWEAHYLSNIFKPSNIGNIPQESRFQPHRGKIEPKSEWTYGMGCPNEHEKTTSYFDSKTTSSTKMPVEKGEDSPCFLDEQNLKINSLVPKGTN